MIEADSSQSKSETPMSVDARRVLVRRTPYRFPLQKKAKKYLRKLRKWARTTWQPSSIRLNGVLIPIDRKLYSGKIIERLFDESYERDERDALSRTLRSTDRLLELGSGIGYMSAYAAKELGVAHVTACEANPSLIPLISRTHTFNQVDSEILHGVMSCDKTTQSCLFYTQEHFWSSSMSKPEGYYETTTVPVLHWQTELDRIQPSYLLMDIEGGEIDLLESFDHACVERMLIEFHPKTTGDASITRIFHQLRSVGFSFERPHGGTNVWYFERQASVQPNKDGEHRA